MLPVMNAQMSKAYHELFNLLCYPHDQDYGLVRIGVDHMDYGLSRIRVACKEYGLLNGQIALKDCGTNPNLKTKGGNVGPPNS